MHDLYFAHYLIYCFFYSLNFVESINLVIFDNGKTTKTESIRVGLFKHFLSLNCKDILSTPVREESIMIAAYGLRRLNKGVPMSSAVEKLRLNQIRRAGRVAGQNVDTGLRLLAEKEETITSIAVG